jgi:ADP-ribose pyrophosphatase
MPGHDAAVGRRLLHRGRKFDFELVEYAAADGKRLQREVVRHPGSVVIVPLLDDGQVVLIRNWRPAVEKELLELPAGTLERGEEPEACARRELIEETGYEARTMERLGRFYTSPGMSDELMTAFVARGLRHVGQRLEEDERLTVAPMAAAAALTAIDSGQLADAKSMLCLLMAVRKGLIGNG